MAYASLGSIRAPAAAIATEVGLASATALATDSHGNVYLAEGSRIRFITADGQIKNVVNRNGFPGAFGDITGSAAEARISGPIFGLYVDGDDNIYFSDTSSNRVRKVTPDGAISTFARERTRTGANGLRR